MASTKSELKFINTIMGIKKFAYISFSIILLIFDNKDIGLQLLHSTLQRFSSKVGMVFDSFKFSMYVPLTKDKLTIWNEGSAIFNFIIFRISQGMLWGPVDIFKFRLFNILIILIFYLLYAFFLSIL